MPDQAEQDNCPECGRVIYQPVEKYTLGRSDGQPIRWKLRWRHRDDNSLACRQPVAHG